MPRTKAYFGPAGNCDAFAAAGYKHTVQVFPWLQEQGLTAYACVVDADATPITDAGMGSGAVAVIGNEGNGLRPETVAACQQAVTIPMGGRAESLNASMAAGIILWEMTRPK